MSRKNRKRYRYEKGQMKEISQPVVSYQTQMTKEITATDFKLEIPDDQFQKIMWWINKANFEVSGFGSLDHNLETNTFTVRDVILLKQEVGPASTEIDPVAIGKAMYRLKDSPNALKWHWHSHVDMGVFWSQDDRELIRCLGQKGWIVATVFNKKREHKTAFYTQTEVMGRPHDLFVDNLPTHIQRYIDDDLAKSLDAEYDDNVKQKVYQTYYHPPYKPYSPTTVYGENYKHFEESLLTEVDESKLQTPTGYRETEPIIPFNPAEWDDNGYVKFGQSWIYNPVFDDSLQNRDEMMAAIEEMAPEELTFLRERCTEFDTLVRDYYIARASSPEVNQDLERLEFEAPGHFFGGE